MGAAARLLPAARRMQQPPHPGCTARPQPSTRVVPQQETPAVAQHNHHISLLCRTPYHTRACMCIAMPNSLYRNLQPTWCTLATLGCMWRDNAAFIALYNVWCSFRGSTATPPLATFRRMPWR